MSRLPGMTGKELALLLLETIGLAGVPGEAFFSGTDGRQFIRFSYAKTDADIDDACQRLARLG
jgi:aminotransferase